MTEWKKSSPEAVAFFESVVPGAPAERRQMFGYPAAFVNGHLFMSLFRDDLILRLPADAAKEMKGAKPFEPMPGRPMSGFVVVPRSLTTKKADLHKWIGRALEHALAIPPKPKKKKAAKSSRARRG